jgi:hypothetical protein
MTALDGEPVMSHWKHFIIGPSKEHATRFYAPDLTSALHAARGFFGTDTLQCYGARDRLLVIADGRVYGSGRPRLGQ